ncbi:unnamed protein product [Ectocarpus sp. 6 AP-2014]
MASTRSEDTPPADTDGKGQLEEKAPVHDASTADHTVPATLQAKTKEALAKVAQTLREDATEDATTTLTLKSSITVVADPRPPPPSSSNGTSSESTHRSAVTTPTMPTPTPTPKLSSTATPPPSLPTPSPSAASLLPSMPSNERRHRAVAAMEEMRKRAARYRETPKEDTDDLTAQMEVLQVDSKMALYDKLFEAHPVAIGKAISKTERDETDQSGNSTLVYGEITFKTLALALRKVKTKYGLPGVGSSGPAGVLQEGSGGAFYDIGSGTGKPVFAAAILHPFHKAVGIEILEGLYATSRELLKAWDGGIRDRVGHGQEPTKVEFFLGDALDMNVCDWSDATVVFANSTCFDDALMRRLASAATALKKGTIFITLTKRLPAAYFKVLEHDMFPMSWGSATVYISQKTTAPFGDPSAVEEDSSTGSQDGGGSVGGRKTTG